MEQRAANWLQSRCPQSWRAFCPCSESPDLDAKEQEQIQELRQLSREVDLAYDLVQQVAKMQWTRTGEKLDDWLTQAQASQIPELRSSVVGVQRDKAAVEAGLTLQESNGIAEGKVHKLKLIKRMSYGRASFPFLRQRVLHAL